MLTIITRGLSFQAGFHAPATSPARAMATMDATALKQARTDRCRSNSPIASHATHESKEFLPLRTTSP